MAFGKILLSQKTISGEKRNLIEGAVEEQIRQQGEEEVALASLKNIKDLESEPDKPQDSEIVKP